MVAMHTTPRQRVAIDAVPMDVERQTRAPQDLAGASSVPAT